MSNQMLSMQFKNKEITDRFDMQAQYVRKHMNEDVDLLCLSLVKFLFSVNCVMMLTHHLCSALSTPKVETPLTELWSFVNSRIDFGAKL